MATRNSKNKPTSSHDVDSTYTPSTFTDIYKRELHDKGVVSSARSAITKGLKERLDPRNILFGGSGVIGATGRKLFGKGYSSGRGMGSDRNFGAALGANKETNTDMTEVVKMLQPMGVDIKIIAKNTMSIHMMARDMNVARQGIQQLVKLGGGKPARGADAMWNKSNELEQQYESKAAKDAGKLTKKTGKEPTKIEEKKTGGGSIIDSIIKSLKDFAAPIVDILSPLVKALIPVAGVFLAAFAGYKFGTWLNEKFGLSEKILDGMEAIKKFVEDVSDSIEDGFNEFKKWIADMLGSIPMIGDSIKKWLGPDWAKSASEPTAKEKRVKQREAEGTDPTAPSLPKEAPPAAKATSAESGKDSGLIGKYDAAAALGLKSEQKPATPVAAPAPVAQTPAPPTPVITSPSKVAVKGFAQADTDYQNAVIEAANITGIPAQTLATFGQLESGSGKKLEAKTSSAKGPFQFIDSTWLDTLKKYGPDYGVDVKNTSRDDLLKLRFNNRLSAIMAALFMKDNAKKLNIDPTDPANMEKLYLAHFLGAGGAKTVLSGKELSNRESVASSNKGFVGSGSGEEILAAVHKKVSSAQLQVPEVNKGTALASLSQDNKNMERDRIASVGNTVVAPTNNSSKTTNNNIMTSKVSVGDEALARLQTAMV